MRLLVITRAPWVSENATGNTLTNFFHDFKDVEIYSLCMREAPSVSKIPQRNFYISEQQFIKKLLKKGQVGKITEYKTDTENASDERKLYAGAKKINVTLLAYVRELLWDLNLWKNEALDAYLEEAKPDVVFFPDFPCLYAHKVFAYIIKKTKAKAIIYHADDCYTLKHFSMSPLFWLYRFSQRKWVRRSVGLCQIHYTISDVQKKDYDRAFGVNHKVLTKYENFEGEYIPKKSVMEPLTLVYTGNIEMNRWKSLAIIAAGLKRMNKEGTRARLLIYTGTRITKKIKTALDISGASLLMGSADFTEIPSIQENADILVHVESFDLKNRLNVRQSFSTKIVDYMKRGRAIMTVGPIDVASIKHLIENKCTIYASNEDEVVERIQMVLSDNTVLNKYAESAFLCGKRYHNKKDMQKMLYEDIEKLACADLT